MLGTDAVSAAALLVVVSSALLADHTNRLFEKNPVLREVLGEKRGKVKSIR